MTYDITPAVICANLTKKTITKGKKSVISSAFYTDNLASKPSQH